MRVKILLSAGLVTGLMVLSTIALANTPDNRSIKAMPNQAFSTCIVSSPIRKAEAQIEPKAINMAYTESERLLLVRIAMAEAEGENTIGKALVMRVILNRVSDVRFPNSIESVIFQAGQFSPVADGRFYSVEPDGDCWEALKMIECDRWDESQGATYFESKSESTWHSENLEFLFQHGKHYFYRERED